MSLASGVSDNLDGTKNYNVGLQKDNASGTLFANGYADGKKGPTYGAAGGNITLGNEAAKVGVTGVHIPKAGNQLTGSANVNLVHSGPHKVEAHAFTTKTFPRGPAPSFNTHGGGVDYSYKDTFKAGASTAHTPAFKHTQQSLSTGVNLISTPTSSLSLNANMTKATSPFQNSGWQPGGSLAFRKQF